MTDIALAIDIGGTKTAVGVVDREGRIVAEQSGATPSESSQAIVAETVALAQNLLSKSQLRERVGAVGVGVPGTLDLNRSTVVWAPNIPLSGTPVKRLLEDELGRQVFVDNDANLAALGEAIYGAGRSVRHVIMLTLGTGIGGGIVIDRHIYRGGGGNAGEIGHMLFPRNGSMVDWEALASGTALVRRMREELVKDGHSVALELAGSIEAIAGSHIGEAARMGDALAVKIFRELAYWLGIGFANIAAIFNPELIIIGGGLAEAADLYLDEARKVMLQTAIAPNGEEAKLVLAELGNRAGLLGAAALAFSGEIRHI